MTKAEGRYLKM